MARRPNDLAKTSEKLGDGQTLATQRRAGLAAIALLFLAGLFTLREFLPALIWAVIVAVGIWPMFQRATTRWPQHRRRLLPGLAVALLFLALVAPIALVTAPLAGDAHAIGAWLDNARQVGVPPPPVFERLPYGDRLAAAWRENLGQPGEISLLMSRALQGGLAAEGRRIGVATLHRVLLVGFMLLTLFLLLAEVETLIDQAKIASQRAFGPAGEKVGRQMLIAIHGAVNGLVLVGLAEGAILGATYFGTGVPHATLFGLLTALLSMAPFGAAVAFIAASLVLFALNHIVGAVVVLTVGFVVTFVADHFVRPVLIGGATRLPFLWVLLGILGGVGAWGLMGLFIGPAILAALMLIWREWVGAQSGPISPPERETTS